MIAQFVLGQPDWATEELGQLPEYFPGIKERMEAVIRFSRLNIEYETGGPFAAGVFETLSGPLVLIGLFITSVLQLTRRLWHFPWHSRYWVVLT